MVWARTATGARIPLDPRAAVYMLSDEVDSEGMPIALQQGEGFMVSHFKTCPKATAFSGSKKRDEPRP